MSREISLTRGKVALVDDADYDKLAMHKWQASPSYGTWYASRRTHDTRVQIYMHREIINAEICKTVDHKNGDGLDNRRQNLRLATTSQNMANQRKRVEPTSSKYKGVTWKKSTNKWHAQLKHKSKEIGLGDYIDEIEAARAYDAKARELFGEFAKPNFNESSNAASQQ